MDCDAVARIFHHGGPYIRHNLYFDRIPSGELLPGDRHVRKFDGWTCDATSKDEIIPNHFDTGKHSLQVARNGDLLYRICQFPVFNPESRCPPRVITCDHVDTKADEICYIETALHRPDNLLRCHRTRHQVEIRRTDRMDFHRHFETRFPST